MRKMQAKSRLSVKANESAEKVESQLLRSQAEAKKLKDWSEKVSLSPTFNAEAAKLRATHNFDSQNVENWLVKRRDSEVEEEKKEVSGQYLPPSEALDYIQQQRETIRSQQSQECKSWINRKRKNENQYKCI